MCAIFGIYFETHYYGEKRLQPSRRRRDHGKIVSSERHFRATWSYIETRKQERGLNAEGQRVTLADEEKVFNGPPPAMRMRYLGLPTDPQDAWRQCQENASPGVTYRYYEFGPDPTLVELLFDLDRADLVHDLVVDGFYEGLRSYSQAKYGAKEPPGMAIAYHEKFDQYGRPQPHLHALSEATLTNGDADRVEMKLFKEQLADLREVLDESQGMFLDRHLPDMDWRTMYQQRHAVWEIERDRIEQARLGQDIESTLVATGIIAPALERPPFPPAAIIHQPSDIAPAEVWPEELERLLAAPDRLDRSVEDLEEAVDPSAFDLDF